MITLFTNAFLVAVMNVIDFPKRPTNLDKLIRSLVNAMQADYTQQFDKTYPSEDDKEYLICRMHTHFKGKNLDDISNAYEDYIQAGNKFLPNVPELLGLIEAAAKSRRQTETNQAEALRIANTPPTPIHCDPLEMLKEAREAFRQAPETQEERRTRLNKAIRAHELLLLEHRDKIKRGFVDADHTCHIPYCDKPGSLSNGTTGKGNFYCSQHFREFA